MASLQFGKTFKDYKYKLNMNFVTTNKVHNEHILLSQYPLYFWIKELQLYSVTWAHSVLKAVS